MPCAGPELRTLENSIAAEAGLLQGALFSEVVNVRRRLDAVCGSCRKEMLGKHPLRLCTEPLPPCLRDQGDAYVPGKGLRVWAVSHLAPGHGANRYLGDLDDQGATGLTDEPVLLDHLVYRRPSRHAEVVEATAVERRRPPKREQLHVF